MSKYLYRNGAAPKRYSLAEYERSHPVSDHFVLGELASRDGATDVYLSPTLLVLLERVRSHFGKPVMVNSAYRSAGHNAAVGGVDGSQHTTGHAADISVLGVDEERVYGFADRLGVNEVGIYDTFVHLGVRGATRDRWDARTPEVVASAPDMVASGGADGDSSRALPAALRLALAAGLVMFLVLSFVSGQRS